MRRLIAFFVRQNLFGDLLTLAVIALGLLSAVLIRREVFPNVSFDIISVATKFPGASPSEVEKFVTNPMEQDLQEVDGIKRLQSVSVEGLGTMAIWLDPDQTTVEEGKADVQDVVDRLTPELPDGAEKPEVTSVQTKQQPIIEVSISGDLPAMKLRRIAKDLERELEKVPGVARVVHRGLRDIEIRVEADQRRLSRYRVSLDELVAALKGQNLTVPGGTLDAPPPEQLGTERIVRTVGDFTGLDDVRKTVIRANDMGQPIRVSDVAVVDYDLERARVLNRTNGHPSLSLTILKKEKADAIELVDSVKARMAELKPSLGNEIGVDYINDFSYYIRRRLSILTSNLLIGLLFVLALLPLMLPFRFSILIALGEPFAFLGTLLILYYTGNSINLISMIGLIIVSGILVDDSIVVTENAVRLVESGMEPKKAAVTGTLQIFGPVTASVLTTSSAFLPMLFMTGIFGKFTKQIPIAVVTALAVSLFETYFILPAHIAHWIKARPGGGGLNERKGPIARIAHWTRRHWDQEVVPLYLKYLEKAVRKRYWVAGTLTVVFFASLLLAARGMRFVLFPPEGVEIFFIRSEAPVGTSLERHAHLIRPVEKAVLKLPKEELDDTTTSVGLVQQDPNDPNTRRGAEYAQIAVFLTPETQRKRTAAQIIETLRAELGLPDGLTHLRFERVNPGPPTGKPVSLGVRGRTYEEIMPVAEELKKVLSGITGVSDVADNYNSGKEEIRVLMNSAEAAAAGLSVASVGTTIRAAFEGIVATTVRELDEEIDVRVSLTKSQRSDAATLGGILIPNRMGNLVPLGSVARLKPDTSVATYQHEGNQRQVKVTAEVDTHITSAVEVNNRVREQLSGLRKKFPAIDVNFGGEDEDTKESMASLGRAFVLALVGIFLILVLTFRSIIQPLVVLLTVPLGIIAVIWAFFLHGLPLSFMGMLGIIALAGVIVNNAIVFVDFVNQARENGMAKRESILEAARMRIRPIFLTTVTTVVGILPTAYGLGGLDKFVVPIAMALGWGLAFGSVLTAFVFPAALAILDDVSGFMTRAFPRVTRSYGPLESDRLPG